MNNLLNAADIKEQVSLVDLLSRLGHEPVRRTGKELLYLSMLRESDTKPSFAVNEVLNVWFDHGSGKGGNIVDFGVAYWPMTSFIDVLHKIQSTVKQEIVPNHIRENARQRMPVKIPHYEIEDVKDMGNNAAIAWYIKDRGIGQIGQDKLKEVYYYVEDQKKLRKHFFAAGWQNELGGWEVRNRYFKGCLGHKAHTVIQGNAEKLVVFEGYLDYLSWMTENEESNASILVLNTLSLLEAGIRRAKAYPEIDLYFDRDKSGHKASLTFQASIPYAQDRSAIYDGFKDYNDRLKAGLRNAASVSFQPETEAVRRTSFSR
ncbi:Toprim-like [Mucilaginibacter pineti]|uniref:Toprim-like n=1 Tax=Mucilaginibacter pineti TaxID=1391627 RepID=A0A1G7NA50_9SPHI|nr:toprim domain-containing protein [Mucilaginibacter pineti]SDF70259.1 Toprim-like [Mucilaginibacter pineti]